MVVKCYYVPYTFSQAPSILNTFSQCHLH